MEGYSLEVCYLSKLCYYRFQLLANNCLGGKYQSVVRAMTQATICAKEIKPIKAAFKNLITLLSEIEKGLKQNESA